MLNEFEYGDLVTIKKSGFLEGRITGRIVGDIFKKDGSVYYIVRTDSTDHICNAKDLTLIRKG